jgi:hypothetical protein
MGRHFKKSNLLLNPKSLCGWLYGTISLLEKFFIREICRVLVDVPYARRRKKPLSICKYLVPILARYGKEWKIW